jgi:hypothetical protein
MILLKFCEQKAKKIASRLLDIYDLSELEINQIKIEREIYRIALSYSDIFLFFHIIDFEKNKEELVSQVGCFTSTKENILQKMSIKELMANLIKSYTIKELEELNEDIIFV